MSTHECPAPSCERRLPQHIFACKPHWFSLPKPLRDELWRTWDEGGGVFSDGYAKARQACVDYLRGQG